MNYFPNGVEEISLLKFIATFEYLNEKDTKYFFKSKNCALYTGVRKYDKSVIEGVMMAVNMELGYQHILMFSLDKTLFDNPENQQVKVQMYSYVPIHNVSSLF